jgi:hypothetical protein
MSLQLQERVKCLEEQVKVLRAMLLEVSKPTIRADADLPQGTPVAGEILKLDLCPKCGVKPNKYFHTRVCQGK